MKGTVILAIALLFGFLAASGCISAPAGQAPATTTPVSPEGRPHYVIGVDAHYPPFTYRDDTGNFTGLDIESARWIAHRQGFDVEFVAVPWNGILTALLNGTIDMVYSGMTITPERQQEFDFTIPYFTVTKSVAVRSGSNITMPDLIGGHIRIGAQAGATGAAWVEENLIRPGKMPAGQMFLYPDVPALTEALVNGTIDASISDTPTQEQTIAGKPLVILGEIPTGEHYAVAVRKTDPHLRATMDEGLRQLMADPEWQELLKKYGQNTLTNFPFRKPL
jgi:polar amino acid transport system substrate-binding protein